MEVTCGCVACMIGHCWDGEGEVALNEDGGPPPFGPDVVSSGVGSEFWGAYGVEFRCSRVSGVLEDKSVGLGLEAEGVVVHVHRCEDNCILLLGRPPLGGRLYCIWGL